MSATAGWPLDRLVAALARAGWDVLDGRRGGGPRAVLRALTDLLPHGSATGYATAPQIADAAGLSERWTRETLTRLESAGVITWTRGTIINGRPTASIIKVSKRVLADLVNRGRKVRDSRLARRAAETSRRIQETLRMATIRPRRAAKTAPAPSATPRAALSAALPPIGEETQPQRGAVVALAPDQIVSFRQQLRARLAGAAA